MMNIHMKRPRESEYNTLIPIANYLMLLSQTPEFEPTTSNNRVFECKTCNRRFPSFQALGGHRASHRKKPKLGEGLSLHASPVEPRTHECSICGVEFGMGQALGGHMRRHKVVMNEKARALPDHESGSNRVEPVSKKSINGGGARRVWCLDLNLSIMENDLEFDLGKMASCG